MSASRPGRAPLKSSVGTRVSTITDTCASALTLPATSSRLKVTVRSPSRGRVWRLFRRIALVSAAASEPVSALPSARQIASDAVAAS